VKQADEAGSQAQHMTSSPSALFRWPSSENWQRLLPGMQGLRELQICGLSSAAQPVDDTLIFVSNMEPATLDGLCRARGCLVLANEAHRAQCKMLEVRHGIVYSENPRYLYAELVNQFCDTALLRGAPRWDTGRECYIAENVVISPSAIIEPGATIARDCYIGERAYIMSGARIGPRVRIGTETVIRENAVIGGFGFGLAFAKGRPPLRIPHIGGVVIGNGVEVGALSTICSGTLAPTVIKDHVKIDDHVHIAHNCVLGEEIIATACTEVSGSVRIGARTWLAPNCSIIEKIEIGADCTIGLGAVVIKSVPDGTKVMGNPAQDLRVLGRERIKLWKLLGGKELAGRKAPRRREP
jgi:UDP-3-O-[3-hydroxymyristoyl] glucosamine N-acyltransferase